MNTLVKVMFIFFIQLATINTLSAQEVIIREKLSDENLELKADYEIYYSKNSRIKNIFYQDKKHPLKLEYNKLRDKEYVYIPILNNKIQEYEIKGDFKIILITEDNKENLVNIKYTPKYIDKQENPNLIITDTTKDQLKIFPTKTVVHSFERGDNILNDAKLLIKDIEKSKESPNLRMIKQDILKKYNILYDSIHNYKFLTFYKEYLGDPLHSKEYQHSSNIAKTDVTNFATGMARFLADRAKQELNETFFIQMHKQMNRVQELQVYFPESYIFLNNLNAHSMSFELDHMRARFNQDINQLPKNFYNSTQKNNHQAGSHLYTINNYLKNDPNGQWIDYGLQVVFENNGKINPKELIHNFVHSDARKNLEQKLKKETDKNLLNTIKLAELISSSLLSPDPNRYWVTQDEINNLLSDEKLFQTYIGLLLAKSNFTEYDIQFSDKNLKDIIEHKYTYSGTVQDLKNLKNLVKTLYNSYAEVDNVVDEIAKNNGNFNADKLYKIYNVLNDNISTITTQVNENNILSSKVQVNDLYFKNYIKPSVDIAYNMSSKKYAVAIKGLVQLLENSVNVKQIDLIKNVTNNLGDIENLNGGQLAKSLLIQYLTTDDNFKNLQPLLPQNTPKYFEYLTDASKINELKLFYDFVNEVNLKTENIEELKKIITDPKIENIDELKKLITDSKTTNIDELQKNISNYKTTTIIGIIENSEVFQNVLKYENFDSLRLFINKHNSEIKNLIYIAQHYKFEDLKTKNLEAIVRSYFEDPELVKIALNKLQSNNNFKKHVKRYEKDYNNFLSKFTTYGVLIANVATAQNSDEVKAAIEASVLPVGSSRIKRNSNWSITANAYVGAFYGNAFYKELVNGTLEKRSINTFGVTAPIGITFSRGNLKVLKQNSALGINLQLIDLGSLVNFYMKEGDGASLPRDTQIKLGDIIAPGGSLSYSIGDSPFTLLGGVQYVPNLNRMESIPTNSGFKPATWRVHFGFAIDIPLFNIKIWN